MDPSPFRLFELIKLADAAQRAAWWRTAHTMCMLGNIHRKKGARPFTPRDFFPFDRQPRCETIPITKGTIHALRVFLR